MIPDQGRRIDGDDPGASDEARAARRADRDRTRDLLDLAEGRGDVPLLDDDGIEAVLRSARRIAVVGASADPARPSQGVLRTLLRHGYDCVPVNPDATEILGLRAFPTVIAAVEATGPVDVVDVFRRAEMCVPHAEEAVAVGAACLWLQLGIVNREAARIAAAGGLSVVMDRCMAIELGRIGGVGPRPGVGPATADGPRPRA
ncbi:MAG: CoA-binding protein [Chloroflexota bacterium]